MSAKRFNIIYSNTPKIINIISKTNGNSYLPEELNQLIEKMIHMGPVDNVTDKFFSGGMKRSTLQNIANLFLGDDNVKEKSLLWLLNNASSDGLLFWAPSLKFDHQKYMQKEYCFSREPFLGYSIQLTREGMLESGNIYHNAGLKKEAELLYCCAHTTHISSTPSEPGLLIRSRVLI